MFNTLRVLAVTGACHDNRLRGLATKPGEKCGLALLAQDLHTEAAQTRAVHLDQKDALPAAEDELPERNRHRDGMPEQYRGEMRLRVQADAGTGVVDFDACRMRHRDHRDPRGDSDLLQLETHHCRDVFDADAAGSLDG